MSWTEGVDPEERIRRFFAEQLSPAAAAIRRRRGELFATRPDPQAETYYRRRSTTRMSAASYEVDGLGSVEGLETALRSFWESRGLPELASLSPGLTELARLLRPTEEQTDEVSPFIYVMF